MLFKTRTRRLPFFKVPLPRWATKFTISALTCISMALGVTLTVSHPTHAALHPESYDADLEGAQKAFPTAEGFGKYAQGGRGGDVYIVSSLQDSGPGTLRECVEAYGPRTCVFSVSGEIKTEDAIRARNPYLTIAGQTAPGDGIMLTIRDTDSVNYPLAIEASHVIVRHIAVRPGPSQTPSDNVKSILVGRAGAQHIILDHVTMSWGTDETLTVIGNSGITNRSGSANAGNVTIQWSMIYESLELGNHASGGPHSRSTYMAYGIEDVSFHHNIIANSNRRNPNFGAVGQVDFVNNVLYNSGKLNGELYNRHGSTYFNWIGNVSIAGPATQKRIEMYQADLFNNQDLGHLEMYVKDNLDIHRTTNTGDDRLVIDPKDYDLLTTAGLVGYGELSLPTSEISGPEQAYKDVLAFAGAIKPKRDKADADFVAAVLDCEGDIIDDPSEVGAWPILNSTTPPLDNDQDGMADNWEIARRLNPNDAADRNADDNADGYTNLEEYLNELAGDRGGSNVGMGTGPDPDPTCGYSFRSQTGPTIYGFEVYPPAIKAGEQVTIYWDADADACKRSWDRTDPFFLSGSQSVTLTESTSLDLICTAGGTDDWMNRYVFVTPDGQVPIPSVGFTADKTTLSYSEEVTFTWRAGRIEQFEAGECEASGAWNGFKTTAGQESFRVMYSGDYHLTCIGPGGATTETITLNVAGAPPPPPTAQKPTASITADSINLSTGKGATLTWTSTNADSCTATGNWSGTKATVGTETVSSRRNATYTITCTGAGGTAVDSASVSVTQPPRSSFETGARVTVNSPANLRDAALQGTGELQNTDATGVIVDGPQDGSAGTQFWAIDFDSGADGWVRDSQLDLLGSSAPPSSSSGSRRRGQGT